jgi:hypothetical protein
VLQRYPDAGSFLGFVFFTILISVVYGIAHDMVTAHVCVPYFTEYHPKIIASDSPVVMALLWGLIATWWVGLYAGILLAVVNVAGPLPRVPWALMRKRLAIVMVALLVVATVVLALGYFVFYSEVRPSFDRRFSAVAQTHLFSYVAAAAATLGLAVWNTVTRVRLWRHPLQDNST